MRAKFNKDTQAWGIWIEDAAYSPQWATRGHKEDSNVRIPLKFVQKQEAERYIAEFHSQVQ